MAKPKHGRVNNVSSTPSRNRPTHAPSPAILSALAIIATVPTVVAGSPVPSTHPPAFLCPFIERDNIPSPSVASPPLPNCGGQPSQCDVVADKYIQGPDNFWRKTDKWTLYGSTCTASFDTSQIHSQPSSSRPSTPSPNHLDTTIDTSDLPAGWGGSTSLKSSTESTIILTLAIVLASSICFFMIGCVIWRRRKKRARDIERKVGQTRGAQDDPQDTRDRMRMWAKATARWKSNIRHSARRRRKRQSIFPAASRPFSPTLSDSLQHSLVTPTIPHRSSIASEELDPSTSEVVLSPDCDPTEPSTVPHDPPRPASPPTYGASFVPRPLPRSAVPRASSADGPDSTHHSNRPSSADDEPLPYIPPSDGHVATDDKSQLAQIRQLASSPPISINTASVNTMQSVSAPRWHEMEDDFEDLDIHLNAHNFAFPPPFPPPPSEAGIPSPFGYLDDHTHCYGDGVLYPVSPVPSLTAFPNAPPLNDPGLEPSAPSLECDDELFQDWDGALSCVPEVPVSASPEPTPARVVESPIPSIVPSASRDTSFPSTSGDGILPRYHP